MIQERWTISDSSDLYGINTWGREFFSINEAGHLTVGPQAGGKASIDLKELTDQMIERGISLPLLFRFSDLLKARIEALHSAFTQAMSEGNYRGDYRSVYPIKVNQNRFLVEDLMRHGRPFHYGLEAGSKPELLAVMAMLNDAEALVICNGYKDEEYVETALLGSRLGPKVILVVEKPAELRLILKVVRRTGIRPLLGIRARLSTRGAGHWEASGGDRSKFGLGARELLEAVELLRDQEMLDCLILLHFHLGSQISSIRNIKDALREGGWLYVNLVKMGVPLAYFDTGGGLAVDYDGSQTNSASSMNYTTQEYANDVIASIMEVCDPENITHPILVTEAGRATVAHHALLVVEVLDVGEFRVGRLPSTPPQDITPVLKRLFETYQDLTRKNLLEAFHDAQQYRDECMTLFTLGHLSLEHRVLAEDIFWALCRKTQEILQEVDKIPLELKGLTEALADTYFCNFSIFQSLPDSWAIDQLFPVVPIHRLDEIPTRNGIVADMTCDSDGKIDRFIHPREMRPVLDLHPLRQGEPYYLGIFFVGAYQEILGDLHNLFGDTNTVHLELDGKGGYHIQHVVAGDTVREVLRYVGYQKGDLVANLRRSAELAIKDHRMTRAEARHLLQMYEDGLGGYTYLERE
jgi:arginine decarboxylase